MFKNLKWLRLVPDRPGKGGQKTGFHSFQAQPINDTWLVKGFHIYRGRWRKDYATQSFDSTWHPDNGATVVKSLHPYLYPSLTDPSAQPSMTLLGHHTGGGLNRYWDFTNNTTRDTHAGNAVPATFLDIEGRCFVADGAREGMVLDDRTPAIHLQKNQNLGIGSPSQSLPNTSGGLSPYGSGYVHYGSPYINHPNPANPLRSILSTDYVDPSFINVNLGAVFNNGALMTSGLPTVDAVSSDSAAFTATGTVSITTGTSLVTLAGATWPANYAYAGLAINFAGYSFVILSHGTLGIGVGLDLDGNGIALSNVQLLIMGIYNGPTISAPGVPYTITGVQVGPLTAIGNTSGATTLNTAAGTFGYSQSTASNLVQVKVLANLEGAGGLWRNLGNISLGPPATDSDSTGSIQTISDGSMLDKRPKLTSAVSPFAEEDVGAPIAVDGASSSGGILTSTISVFIDSNNVRLGASNTSGGNIGPVQAWWGADPIVSDGAMAGGSSTLTSASTPFTAGDVGQTIVIENAGDAGGTIALITTIATFVNSGQITVTASRAGFVAVSSCRVWWRGISVLTHAGPQYAYAWYDPETGHMSNISPLFQIPRPTDISNYTDFANVTPVFQIDTGYISYPSGVDATRFSHIVFFRTLSDPNTSTLFPIGSLMPYVGKVHPGSASTRGSYGPSLYHGWMGVPNNYVQAPPTVAAPQFWFDFSSDEDLILTGGFRAPQFTNEKPMALLAGGLTQPAKPAYEAYWDRRLWIVSTQEPDKVMFSCDDAQCPLGIPVESFPPTNFLRIPSVDGKAIGMRTVGEMLVITTERWAYTVVGNNESNYRLIRVSTRMGGVGTYQMDELTSDVEGQPSIVYFLGKDKIVYEWVPGGSVTPISEPIQDKLNSQISSTAVYDKCRVHCVSAWARRLVIVSTWVTPSFDGTFFIFDVTNRVWTTNANDNGATIWTIPPSAMTTIYGMEPPVNEIYSIMNSAGNQARVFSWIRDDGPVQANYGIIFTFPLDFDGKKTRKELKMINVHVSADTGGIWQTYAMVDEGISHAAQAVPYEDLSYSIYGSGPFTPIDSPTEKDLVALTAKFNTDGAALVGYRFTAQIVSTVMAAPTELYAIDIGYTDWEEPGDGDP